MQTFQDRLRSLIDALGITKTKFAEDRSEEHTSELQSH